MSARCLGERFVGEITVFLRKQSVRGLVVRVVESTEEGHEHEEDGEEGEKFFEDAHVVGEV